MKPSEIRAREPKELVKIAAERCREIFDLRLGKATGKLADLSKLAKTKKDIARILTILQEKEAKP